MAEATNLTLAERIKREYASLSVFSQDIADAHMRGDIHLHSLGFVDRPYCCGQSLEYVKRFGLNLPNLIAMAKPAEHPEGVPARRYGQIYCGLLQLFRRGHRLGFHQSRALLVGMSDRELEQLAQMMIFKLSEQTVARGGQAIFTDRTDWEIPEHRECPCHRTRASVYREGLRRLLERIPALRQMAF